MFFRSLVRYIRNIPCRWGSIGGPYSVAALRIGIALSALSAFHRVAAVGAVQQGLSAPFSMYRAVGILLVWPGRPSVVVVSWVLAIGTVSTYAMLIGFRSRLSSASSALCLWFLTSYDAAFSLPWSHGYSPVVIVSLAFVGARSGDVWSLDAGLRRWAQRFNWRPARSMQTIDPHNFCYRWPILLVTFTLSLVFVAAGLMKLYSGGWNFAWIFSDNLRNQIASRYGTWSEPRTPLAEWLIQSPWRYETAALLNICNQVAPALVWLVMHRPRLRATIGLLIAIEILALGYIMNFWHERWLTLLVVFIDWDALRHWVISRWPGRRIHQAQAALSTESTLGPVVAPKSNKWLRYYLHAFVVSNLIICFGFDQRLRTFPFSGFPMYARLRVAKPYSEHLPYDVVSGRIEVHSEPPFPAAGVLALNQMLTFKKLWQTRDEALFRAGLQEIFEFVKTNYPNVHVHSVAIFRSAYRIPAYPALPDAQIVDLGMAGQYDEFGVYGAVVLQGRPR